MSPPNPTIMLVDGTPTAQPALSASIEDAGYALVTVSDGLHAWDMLEADPRSYDVVILDHASPGLDGVQLLDRMRGHPVLHQVPTILQTETAKQAASPGTEPVGVTCCLAKPFGPAQLLGAVARALQYRVSYRSQDGRDCTEGQRTAPREATFTFKTLDSARELATLLADTCPEPQRVVVGLAELLLNAVEHGNLRISYEEKARLRREERWEQEVTARLADPTNADKEVWVEYVRETDRIRIRIRDQGDGFDWRGRLATDPAEAMGLHGRGIAIARIMSFDTIEYRGSGNEVEVTVDVTTR